MLYQTRLSLSMYSTVSGCLLDYTTNENVNKWCFHESVVAKLFMAVKAVEGMFLSPLYVYKVTSTGTFRTKPSTSGPIVHQRTNTCNVLK